MVLQPKFERPVSSKFGPLFLLFDSISLWHGIVVFICPLSSLEEFQASYKFDGLTKH